MEHKKILAILCILLIIFSASAQIKTIKTIKIATTTTTTTTTTLVKCSAGCSCLTDASAKSQYKEPQKCGSGICGYYYSSGMTSYQQTPKYCYRDAADATTTTSTARLTVTTTTTLQRAARPATESGCTSCKACSDELAAGKKNVTVARDLSSTDGSCIIFNTDDATFDCRGHTISGYGEGIEFYYGIDLRGDDNIIRNCTIEGFETAIAAYGASNNLIEDNVLKKNGNGIWLGGGFLNNATGEVSGGSNQNRIEENTITENTHGVYFMGNKNTMLGENRICRNSVADIYTNTYATSSGNIRNDDVCDLIYNWNSDSDVTWCDTTCTADAATSVGSASGLQDALAGGAYGRVTLTGDVNMPDGISFGASHVTVDCGFHTIRGGGSGTGVDLSNKVNVEVRNCTIENYGTGILMDGTSHSRILGSTIKDNDYGLAMRSGAMASRTNNISSNKITPSDVYGIYLDGNVWDNTLTGNSIIGKQYSLYTNARCDNIIPDSNVGSGGKKIGYYHDTSGLSVAYPTDRKYAELILCNVRDSTFSGVEVDNSGIKSDGILIINSRNVALTNPSVKEVYGGIAVINSTDVTLTSSLVTDPKKDCIIVEKSIGAKIDAGTLRGCEKGVYVMLSTGTEVKDVLMEKNSIAGVHLYMSASASIEDNTIRGNGTNPRKGIFLEESSDDNRISGNTINQTSDGIQMDGASSGNTLEDNLVCGNNNDIYDLSGNNTGRRNTCSVPINWDDEGTAGCRYCCSPAVHDINKDGVDDACDCYDAYKGYGETGVDCGGKCGDCVECTWCNSNVEALRIKGRPNDGMIDVVFVPHESFRYNMTTFESDAYGHVRNYYLKLHKLTNDSIPADYRDRFNFYIYRGGYGYDGQCAGELPGEEDYTNWIAGCSVLCGLTLGLGCGCFAYEPDHFYGDAGWADVAGILTMNSAGCANTLGPQSHYIAERAGPVVTHESGHALFGLVDEYCGHTYYTQPGTHPNVWSSLGGCQTYASSHGWNLGNCRQIQDINASGAVTCSKDYYRYDPDAPTQSYMIVWGSGWNYMFWEAAGERINHVFENYPGGGSRGALIYVRQNDSGMRKLGVTVVAGHPDLGMQEPVYWTEVLSAGKARLKEFGLWDYRRPLADGPGSNADLLSEVTFPVNIPFENNPRWVNIYDARSGELILSMDIGPELYGWCKLANWSGDDCRSLDVDNNGVPDWKETALWDPVERIQNMTFDNRLEIPEEIKRMASAENMPQQGTQKGGSDMNLMIGGLLTALLGSTLLVGGLLLVIILLIVLLLWKRKKK
jgi:parallel beta-helix repeat protein